MTQSHTPVRIHLVTHVPVGPGAEPRGAELPGAVVQPRPPRALDRIGDDVRPTVSSVTTRADGDRGDRFEVLLAGDVDLVLADELDLVLTQADRHCAQHHRARVHLDVQEVTAVDTSGLRFVERLRTLCAQRGATCTTSTARPAVSQVLALARPVVDGQLAAS
ncbi:STAS domain-containing protein [Kineococcus sp. SYSU DK003]|uniref:STAS domain-containing protein n=1 Tax=Kineococcus sp. SYSU DK003 TaxID=3383124 RepID=UPI003D7E8B6C